MVDPGQSSVTVTITDSDGPTVSVMPATASITEGETVRVRFVADAAAAVAVTVPYSISGTATITDDYTGAVATGGMVTIAAGSMEATLEIMAVLDTTPEAEKTIIITADSASRNDGETVAVADSANSTTITINDAPDEDSDGIPDPLDVDDDGDGLIEIATLAELNNVRHNLAGTSYDDEAADSGIGNDSGDTTGCPTVISSISACIGYELVADLDFDIDGDGTTWSGDSATGFTLDADDDNDAYFDVEAGGWLPIGKCTGVCSSGGDDPFFTGIFEGNAHTISNMAVQRSNINELGLFGAIGGGSAQVRNLGLLDALVDYDGSSIATNVGGLVGEVVSSSDSIFASWVTGAVDGGEGGFDRVGGLVGTLEGKIVASWTASAVNGGAGDSDFVGGLVGNKTQNSTVVASYAAGGVSGGDGSDDVVGGLIGRWNSGATRSPVASYATGAVADGDMVGSLIGGKGANPLDSHSIASYGFGTATGTTPNTIGAPPAGVATANALTADNAGSCSAGDHADKAACVAASETWTSWNEQAETLNAWDFGTSSQPPALRFADYDGTGGIDYCAAFPAMLPGTTTEIVCGTTLLPGQPGR